MRLILMLLPLLAGCANPILIGESGEGDLYVVRLTQFRAETAAPGILRAIGTDRGVSADGCQVSGRGELPREARLTLTTERCVLHYGDAGEPEAEPEAEPEPSAEPIWRFEPDNPGAVDGWILR
jgi:hypothetical protein